MKVTRRWHILEYTCDFIAVFVLDNKRLPDGVFVGKIFVSSPLAYDHCEWISQCFFRTPLNEWNRKDTKYGAVGKDHFPFLNILIHTFHKDGTPFPKTRCRFNLRELRPKCFSE